MAAVASLYLHEFSQGLDWVNSAPISLSTLRGRVTLLYFWTGSSIHCQQALAEIKSLEGKFIEGLCVIGVHTPKHSFETSSAVVLKTINRWFIRHPVINDSQWRLWRQFAAVADTLHFGQAAARLHMTQPPLTQAIAQLERVLGVRHEIGRASCRERV